MVKTTVLGQNDSFWSKRHLVKTTGFGQNDSFWAKQQFLSKGQFLVKTELNTTIFAKNRAQHDSFG